MPAKQIKPSSSLDQVSYEIRGDLSRRAHELERQGYEIVHLNIGNPRRFGFRTPETMRLAMIENMSVAEGYEHQKGIFPAREAIVMKQQSRGIMDVSVDDVFIGNGVSELIDLSLRALLEPGDEVLIPSPDYPLWTAAVVLNRGKPVHYDCPAENGFQPDLASIEARISKKTRAIVVISPNNPTGAVYSRETLQQIAELAEKHQLIVFSDEIYDQVLFPGSTFTPMASLIKSTLCVSFSGLSKAYRACGYRVGWLVFSGNREIAQDYIRGVELLAALRLCSNVPGQWAIQTALGGYQSIADLMSPGGRMYETREAVMQAIDKSDYLDAVMPAGAMYVFPSFDQQKIPDYDDQQFAMELLEREKVLLVPGSSFNFKPVNHFRITLLPAAETMIKVLEQIDRLLAEKSHV